MHEGKPEKAAKKGSGWNTGGTKVARSANRISMIFVAGIHTCCTA